MSIPQRLYRIARHKLTDLKERIEQLDEEATAADAPPSGPDLGRSRPNARREAEEARTAPLPSAPPVRESNRTTNATGSNAAGRTSSASGSNTTSGNVSAQSAATNDALAYHYRLLGVEPGSDFIEVQAKYNDLAARADASKFPAGSDDAKIAQEIRKRLDDSYKILRDALDETTRRFNQLEL